MSAKRTTSATSTYSNKERPLLRRPQAEPSVAPRWLLPCLVRAGMLSPLVREYWAPDDPLGCAILLMWPKISISRGRRGRCET